MQDPLYPEPVPAASQLAGLPFIAAVDGYLRQASDIRGLRITIHRTMSRDDQGYLQQMCAYIRGHSANGRGEVGRIFAADKGIIGAAFESGQIWRTKRYSDVDSLLVALRADMESTRDNRELKDVAVSYVAIPFLGPSGQSILILYADCNEFNFFADNVRVEHMVAMCKGFCRLFDFLQENPFEHLRNFPLREAVPVTVGKTVYPTLQEPMADLEPPRFNVVPSFNYEAAAE